MAKNSMDIESQLTNWGCFRLCRRRSFQCKRQNFLRRSESVAPHSREPMRWMMSETQSGEDKAREILKKGGGKKQQSTPRGAVTLVTDWL
eukprot:scaffold69349_cov70-Cyclotella_meneghiniana.AAC.1